MSPSIIFRYFQNLSAQQKNLFCSLGEIYRSWNERLNLISRKDIDNLYAHHVLHSLGIAKIFEPKPGTKLLDVGTGGGFPGIPLAIMFPQAQFHLIDSIGKKITAVQEIIKELDLSNATAENIRAEQLKGLHDFVLGRAVTDLEVFSSWTKAKIHPTSQNSIQNGILYMRGSNNNSGHSMSSATIYRLSDFFEEDFFKEKEIVHLA